MLRSLYSGVSGMRSNQTKMDVIGNNIANVNSTGYKAGRVRFQDMLSQTISDAQDATGSKGSVNPKQVGLGVSVSGIDTIFESGALQPTGRSLDFAIEGDGFFALEDGTYTRDGAFFIDVNGDVVNSEGIKVLDTNDDPLEADSNGNFDITDIKIVKFKNPGGLEKVGGNRYKDTDASGSEDDDNDSVIRQGVLEMSNVDLANEFTEMIITSRAYQANSRTITTSDEMLQELINLKR